MVMRRMALLMVVPALLFAGGWATRRSDSGFSQDGPGWLAVPAAIRLTFVDGYSQGFRDGRIADASDWQVRLIRATGAKQITDKQWKDIQAWEIKPGNNLPDKMTWTGWTATNISNGEIEAGIDRFYADPANQAICWDEAFTIVSHSMAGLTFSEADMGSVRTMAAKRGCD